MEPNGKGSFKEIISFALIALVIVIPVRLYVAQPFIVEGASMEDTFQSGQYLIVDQLSYHFHEPSRGDVIVMRYPKNPSTFFIKRIIGLPGETVEIAGTNVVIHPADGGQAFTLSEPFLTPSRVKSEYASYTLSPGEYFVMGDNRAESSDSRSWGPLPRQDVVGRAVLRLFPFNVISVNPGATHFSQ